jgi:selenocysteine-specific elongation factor
MRVIGTAGHVDHGKSTLVAALTGTHPDRLKEEQAREMTIDLGFAWFTLPDGEEVGIVDVPGHRDFIENMLAGAAGMDAVLFVVAADEGVMPQTREHLAILDLLQVKTGVVVLTKIDMIDEPEWLDLVEVDVRKVIAGTILADAPFARVSARTGQGIPALVQEIAKMLANQPHRPDLDHPRLPIDRIFTMPGFGTVITGTLSDGQLHLGEDVEILPSGLRGRIRGLQSHKRKEEWAVPGSRTAVNISGINIDEITRGDTLVHPGQYRTTQRLDVHFRHLPESAGPLRHSSEVKFFIGASEILARVRLLGSEDLPAGQEGWLQLELQRPVVAVRGDRFILRRPSPGETIGGGIIIEPHPASRHKRFSAEVLQRLESLQNGSPSEVLFQAALAMGPAMLQTLAARVHLPDDQFSQALQELAATNQLVSLDAGSTRSAAPAISTIPPDALLIAFPTLSLFRQKALDEVQRYHGAYPLRMGIPREELKSRLHLQPAVLATRIFTACLQLWTKAGLLVEHGSMITAPGYSIRFTAAQQAQVNRLLARFESSPYSPPSIKEAQSEVGEEIYDSLVGLGELVPVSPEVVFRRQDYERLVSWLDEFFQANESLTVAQFRDTFQTSRRYALGFLEHLDSIGLTIRTGDLRIRRTH